MHKKFMIAARRRFCPPGSKSIACKSLIALAVLLAHAPEAHAAAFAAARFGGEHGTVVTTNPTALYYNPAGMGFSEGTHLFIDGTLALRRATWQHPQSPDEEPDPEGAEGANVGEAKLFNPLIGPMLGATHRIGDLALGLGVFAPFGGSGRFETNEKFADHPNFPLAEDGVQRWHTIEGSLAFVYFSAGAAYRLGPLSLGVSGNLIASSVFAREARNPIGQGEVDTLREGRSKIDVSGVHGSFGLGAMFEAIPERLWFGASYQAQPALGEMELTGDMETRYQGSKTGVPVSFHQSLPDVTRLGARFRPTKEVELRLMGEFTRWSVMVTQCLSSEGKECAVYPDGTDATPGKTTIQNVRRKWNDTFGARLGASYYFSPKWEGFIGTGFETAAVPDETLEPALADATHIAGALGARTQLTETIYVAGSYTHLQFMDRNNIGKSKLAKAAVPTRRADGGGKYTQWIGIFNVNAEFVF